MRRSLRSDTCGEAGNVLIETAVALPVFFTMLFGFISFAMVMFGLGNVTYATRMVLRYACLHSTASFTPTTPQKVNALMAPMVFGYPANTFSTTVSYGSGGNVVGQTVTVKTTITYTVRVPGFSYSGPTYAFNESGVVVE